MSEYNAGNTPCKRCRFYLLHSIKFPCRACNNEERVARPYPGEKIKNYFKKKILLRGESW